MLIKLYPDRLLVLVPNIVSILEKLKQKIETSKQVLEDSIKVTDITRDERLNLCMSCEHLFKPTNTCKKCGCFVKAKTWLKDAKCPLNKW